MRDARKRAIEKANEVKSWGDCVGDIGEATESKEFGEVALAEENE